MSISENIDTFNEEVESSISHISGAIDEINIEDLKNDGFTIRSGNKILKMSVIEESEIFDVEKEVREELEGKFLDKLENIKGEVKSRFRELTDFTFKVREECEVRKKELDRRINSTNIMPDVTFEHARRGLSVVKSLDGKDRYMWLYRGVYHPKYIDGNLIDPSYSSEKLLRDVMFLIETSYNKIVGVYVTNISDLSYFDHYHKDCWGDVAFSNEWKTPDDIIKVAKQAEDALEIINTDSPAEKSPVGLPEMLDISNHCKSISDVNILESDCTIGTTNTNVWSTV